MSLPSRSSDEVIAEILPRSVVSAEAYRDPDDLFLFPEEELVVSRAVEMRRRAFTTGRACARRALAGLGLAPVAIPPDERGAPCWPAGVVGSITHCDGYRAAAVAWAQEAICVGIDAEPHGSLPGGVLRRIASAQEQTWLRELMATHPRVAWDRLLFSAKEAVYKAWYPLTGRRLDFMEALVAFDAERGTFGARLLVPGLTVAGHHLTGFPGRWLVEDGLIVTAVAVTT
jgi:enterobactin synthetase component D / holo-[acyl-carrier protein] synthase